MQFDRSKERENSMVANLMANIRNAPWFKPEKPLKAADFLGNEQVKKQSPEEMRMIMSLAKSSIRPRLRRAG